MRQKGKIDFNRLAKAVGTPGIDPRTWVSYGIVCTITDDGEPNFTDPNAIFVAPDGVWADVLLVPVEVPVTARVQLGVGGTKAQINAPISPGDRVLVALPEGLMSDALVIVAIMNNQAAQLGLDSGGTPQFKNDRLSIFASGIPVEVMTKDGAVLRLEADGAASLSVPGSKKLQLGATDLQPMDGVVTGRGIDSFTGSTYFVLGSASSVVLAKK